MKQHLNNIWSSIHKKVKQHWDGVEKNAVYKKKECIRFTELINCLLDNHGAFLKI